MAEVTHTQGSSKGHSHLTICDDTLTKGLGLVLGLKFDVGLELGFGFRSTIMVRPQQTFFQDRQRHKEIPSVSL